MKNKPAIWWIAVITTAILCASIISGVIFYGVTTAVFSSAKKEQEKVAAINFLSTQWPLSVKYQRLSCGLMIFAVDSSKPEKVPKLHKLRDGGSITTEELVRLCKVAGYK